MVEIVPIGSRRAKIHYAVIAASINLTLGHCFRRPVLVCGNQFINAVPLQVQECKVVDRESILCYAGSKYVLISRVRVSNDFVRWFRVYHCLGGTGLNSLSRCHDYLRRFYFCICEFYSHRNAHCHDHCRNTSSDFCSQGYTASVDSSTCSPIACHSMSSSGSAYFDYCFRSNILCHSCRRFCRHLDIRIRQQPFEEGEESEDVQTHTVLFFVVLNRMLHSHTPAA